MEPPGPGHSLRCAKDMKQPCGLKSVFRLMAASYCESRVLLFQRHNVNLWELNYTIHHGNQLVNVAAALFKL